jgi:hypothetical protein
LSLFFKTINKRRKNLLIFSVPSLLQLWRVCPLKTKRTIREYESVFITATFEEFHEWFNGKIPIGEILRTASPNQLNVI